MKITQKLLKRIIKEEVEEWGNEIPSGDMHDLAQDWAGEPGDDLDGKRSPPGGHKSWHNAMIDAMSKMGVEEVDEMIRDSGMDPTIGRWLSQAVFSQKMTGGRVTGLGRNKPAVDYSYDGGYDGTLNGRR